ncbi:hypothetical protein PENSPDRAFT_655714, partial [Peniophora sp. CONT]
MIMDGEAALALSVGLDEIEFRNNRLSFNIELHDAMKRTGGCTKDADALTITWPANSASYTVSFVSRADALRKVAQLNDTIHFGRSLKVEVANAPPSSCTTPSGTTFVNIRNLPRYVRYGEVHALVRPEGLPLRTLPTGNVSGDVAMLYVYLAMLTSGCSAEDVASVRQSSRNAHISAEEIVTINAPFRTRNHAVGIQNFLNARRLPDDTSFRVILPPAFSYSLTVPTQQFEAQRILWAELCRSISAPPSSKEHCHLEFTSGADKWTICLCISGTNEKAVGAAKVRVEHLAAGETVDGWNSRIDHDAFVERVLSDCGAFVHIHRSQRRIRLYGSPQSVVRARAVVADELARLSAVKVVKHVPQKSVPFLLRQGLSVLRELLGDPNICFDFTNRTLSAPGSDESQHIVRSILEQASLSITVLLKDENQDACPVCFDTVSFPMRLDCGHVYCAACLHHFLVRAVHSDNFPLSCIGDEARCGVPVALPSIMRYLSPYSFSRLLEAAFRAYIVRHPQELRFCRTPDCGQICRVVPQNGPRPVPTQCPACLDIVCPGCNEDVHEGSTCAENRAHNNPAEQDRLVEAWIAGQGGRVKKCPQCGVPVEKTAGCNHIACRCGAHVCWHCTGVFDAGDIYGHMRAAHGSYYAEPAEDPFAGIDHAEQENMLRQAREGRGQRDGGWCIV